MTDADLASVGGTLQSSRYQCIAGTVDRILGSHETTDIIISQNTSTPLQRSGSRQSLDHNQTHTFVNTSREFVILMEVKGRTLKLVSNDYIAVALGDEVVAICEDMPNSTKLVLDWSNVTRNIRFRTIAQPLDTAMSPMVVAILLTIIGLMLFYDYAQYPNYIKWLSLCALLLAVASAIYAFRTADRIARIHAELDRIGNVETLV